MTCCEARTFQSIPIILLIIVVAWHKSLYTSLSQHVQRYLHIWTHQIPILPPKSVCPSNSLDVSLPLLGYGYHIYRLMVAFLIYDVAMESLYSQKLHQEHHQQPCHRRCVEAFVRKSIPVSGVPGISTTTTAQPVAEICLAECFLYADVIILCIYSYDYIMCVVRLASSTHKFLTKYGVWHLYLCSLQFLNWWNSFSILALV